MSKSSNHRRALPTPPGKCKPNSIRFVHSFTFAPKVLNSLGLKY